MTPTPDLDLSLGEPEPAEVVAPADELHDGDDAAPAPADDAGAWPEPPAQVEETTVRALLMGATGAAAMVARDHPANELRPDDPPLWTMTPAELDALVPPLTRVINRRPALVAAVERGDALTVALVTGTYVARNAGRIRAASTDTDETPFDLTDNPPPASPADWLGPTA